MNQTASTSRDHGTPNDSDPRPGNGLGQVKRRTKQSRLILILTLAISLPLLFFLFFTLQVESALRDRLFQDRVDEILRDGQDWWSNFNRTLQVLEQSVLNLKYLVENHIESTPNEFDLTGFDRIVQQEPDGTWRSRRTVYSPTREAGIFIPQYLTVDEKWKCFFFRTWQIVTSFANGAHTHPTASSWVLPASGGAIILWPEVPDFVYQAEPDLDYSNTDWLALFSPKADPDRKARWTSLSFDPVSKDWLISIAAPFFRDGKWGGAVGHDIRLPRFVEYAQLLTRIRGSHFTLIAPDGHLLLSDQLQEEINLANGNLQMEKLDDGVYRNLLNEAVQKIGSDYQAGLSTFETGDHIVLTGRSHGPGWILVNTIPKGTITEELHHPFQWLRLIVLAAWAVAILVVTGTFLRDRYLTLTNQRALMEGQERLEMAVWGGDLGLWDLDIRTGKRAVNQRYAEMLGYTVEEVETTPDFWEERLHPDDKEEAVEAVKANLDGHTEVLQAEYRLRHRNGEWRWIQDTGKIVKRDQNGLPLRASGVHQDITERKKAEETLQLREATLAVIFHAAPIIVGVCEGRIIKWTNNYTTSQLGYSMEEVIGQDSFFLYEDTAEYKRVAVDIQNQLSLGSLGVLETRWVRKDGTLLDILLSFCRLDPHDLSKGTIYAGLDITERKKMDLALQERHETEKAFTARLAILQEVSIELSLCENLDTLCKRAVELGRERLGFDRIGIWFSTKDPLVMKGSFGTGEDGSIRDERSSVVHVTDEWARMFDERAPLVLTQDSPLVDDQMREVGMGTHIFTGMWDGNRVIGGVAVDNLLTHHPITPQDCDLLVLFSKTLGHLCTLKRAQEKLRESEENLAHAQKIARMGNWVWDIQTQRVTFSDQVWNLFGLEPPSNNVNNQGLRDALDPTEMSRIDSEMKKALETAERFETDFQFHLPSGENRYAHAVADFIRNDSGIPIKVHGVIQDITERKLAEEERRSLEQQLQHTQKLESLGVLAGGIAHDFNNLLMAILGNADLALTSLPISSSAHANITEIEKAARRAADLTRQMLAYSGRGRFLTEDINPNELVTEMGALLEASISKRAHLTYNLAPDLPGITADATQIRQVVMNLIVNASEAVGDQEGLIRVSTGTTLVTYGKQMDILSDNTLPEGKYVFIEVSDSGCGMDEETRKRIFDPFFTTKFTGRGLGLAAVLGIVRGHKGAIQLFSEKGRGTIFRILLPALDHPVKHRKAVNDAPPPGPANAMILLVDDEETVRDAGQKMLEFSGYKVLAAENGREALKTLDSCTQQVSCVLLDLTMPFMDGVETLKRIREIRQDIPVIVMSGYTESDTLQKFSGIKPEGFIQKPFTLDSLQEILSRTIQSVT